MSKTNLWFAGTPAFAAHSLSVLAENDCYNVMGVLTQPDRPAGRGRKLMPSAVKICAEKYAIPVAQPAKLLQEDKPFPALARPDLIIVAAYGLLLPQWFLDYPRLGCINIHASLLPRWRGAAPIQRAIEAGDKETGVGIMQMDKGLDTGAVWLEKRVAIENQPASVLLEQLTQLGAEALLEALPVILAQRIEPIAQSEEGVSYAHKLNKAEAQINWQEAAQVIVRKIRAFDLYPIAFSQLDGKSVRFFVAEVIEGKTDKPAGMVVAHHKMGVDIASGDGILRVTHLQLPGKTRMTAGELRNGRDLTGVQFLSTHEDGL